MWFDLEACDAFLRVWESWLSSSHFILVHLLTSTGQSTENIIWSNHFVSKYGKDYKFEVTSFNVVFKWILWTVLNDKLISYDQMAY